MSNVIIWFIEV